MNYLFAMIPSKPPPDWFRSLDSSISKFLWKGKPPRISLKTLQKTKDKGGLDLPNFHHYFLANRLQHISGWLKHTLLDEPWLDVEQALCNNIEISDLPFISSISKRHVCFKKHQYQLFSDSMVGVSKNDDVFTNPMQTYPHLEQSWHIAKQQYDKLHRLEL